MSNAIRLLATAALAAVPVIELRGAIPLGVSAGLPVWQVLLVSILGNMAPVPLIMLFVRQVFAWMEHRSGRLAKKVVWLERRARTKGAILQRYRLLGLFILVAIPLPGTGAWTGALVATPFDLRMRSAVPAIFLGVTAAGLIMCVVSYGVAAVF